MQKSVDSQKNIKLLKEITDDKPKIRNCSYNLYKNVLKPLFKEKKNITLQEIIQVSGKKKSTILCYLSELYNYQFISKVKNLKGDKRTKIYKEIISNKSLK